MFTVLRPLENDSGLEVSVVCSILYDSENCICNRQDIEPSCNCWYVSLYQSNISTAVEHKIELSQNTKVQQQFRLHFSTQYRSDRHMTTPVYNIYTEYGFEISWAWTPTVIILQISGTGMFNNIRWNRPADPLIVQIKYRGGEEG